MDAGNVWLLNNETQRPGGEFRIKGLLKEIALGTGFGLRYDFSYIVVRADLGIPIHAPYSTGKSGYYNSDGSFWKGLVLNLAIGYPLLFTFYFLSYLCPAKVRKDAGVAELARLESV